MKQDISDYSEGNLGNKKVGSEWGTKKPALSHLMTTTLVFGLKVDKNSRQRSDSMR